MSSISMSLHMILQTLKNDPCWMKPQSRERTRWELQRPDRARRCQMCDLRRLHLDVALGQHWGLCSQDESGQRGTVSHSGQDLG